MKTKKIRLFYFIILLIFCIIAIPTADMIITSRAEAETDIETPTQTQPQTTLNPELFEPVTDEDIMLDEGYLALDRSYRYTEGHETVIITDNDYTNQSRLCKFFGEYFETIIDGDAQTYATFFSDAYKANNSLPQIFTKQKLYSMTVQMLSSYYFTEGQNAGITRYIFEVNYAIKDNNGTFRNDMLSDLRVPLLFEVLSTNNTIQINSVGKYISDEKIPKGENNLMDIIMEAMPYIWITVVVLGLALEAMTAMLVAIWFIPAALISMILALCNVNIWVQIYTFIILTVVLLVLCKTVFKKHLTKPSATNLDTIIGMTAVVCETIDNVNEKGAVKVAGKVWSARNEDNEIIEAGSLVTVLEIRGVKLICRIQK